MKLFLFPKFLFVLSLFPVFATADCTCAASGRDTVLTTRTDQGKSVVVRFAASPVTGSTKEAAVCTDPAAKLNVAKLFMPAHGHGTAPTQIVQETAGCALVKKMSFVMTGTWDLNLKYEDADQGKVSVEVK